jgi:thymidylate synthase (FAD)
MSYVELISSTPNAEEIILYCARVSSPHQDDGNPDLLKYLIRNKHWSPFEMANMLIEINTTRAISQQIIRHRSFSFQEFSQRYAEVADWEYTEGTRMKGDTNRQGSIPTDDEEIVWWWDKTQSLINDQAFLLYKEALKLGIAPEVARNILPVAAKTKLYMNGTLRSWIHYFDLRCDEHTQLEHRGLALCIRALFTKEFPIISEALWPET